MQLLQFGEGPQRRKQWWQHLRSDSPAAFKLLVWVLYLKYTETAEWVRPFAQACTCYTVYQQRGGTDGCLSLRLSVSSSFPPHHVAGGCQQFKAQQCVFSPPTHTYAQEYKIMTCAFTHTNTQGNMGKGTLMITGNAHTWSVSDPACCVSYHPSIIPPTRYFKSVAGVCESLFPAHLVRRKGIQPRQVGSPSQDTHTTIHCWSDWDSNRGLCWSATITPLCIPAWIQRSWNTKLFAAARFTLWFTWILNIIWTRVAVREGAYAK